MKTETDHGAEPLTTASVGDKFTGLVSSHFGWVFRMARRQLGDATMAEDATQVVFLDLWRKRQWISCPDQRVGGWLVRATQHACNNLRRSEQRRMICERKAAIMQMEHRRLLAGHSTDDEELAALDAAMPHLSSSDQNILVARYYQHQSVLEVAEQLGITETVAEKRISRAMDRLGAVIFRQHSTTIASSLMSLLIVGLGTAPPDLAEKVLQITRGGVAVPPAVEHAARKLSSYWTRMPVIAAIAAAPVVVAASLMPVVFQFPHTSRPASPSQVGSVPVPIGIPTRIAPRVTLPTSQSLHELQLKIKVRSGGSDNAVALTGGITGEPQARSMSVGLGGPNPQAGVESKGLEPSGGRMAAK